MKKHIRWIALFSVVVLNTLFWGCDGGEDEPGLLGGVITWSHQAYLKAPNNDSNGDAFGYSVAVSGDTIVVGALYEDSTTTDIINGADLSSTNNSGSGNGAAYVFVRSGSAWTHQAYLKAPNNDSNGDGFGQSVAISGDTIVVGAAYEASTTTEIINGNALERSTNNSGSGNGAAYVFVRSGSTWTHQAYLKAPNNDNGYFFGVSVAVSGNTIVAGACYEGSTTTGIISGADLNATNQDGVDNGAAYVFVRSGSTWTHQAYLKAPNNSDHDIFGASVAISGNTIVVGATGEASTTTGIINGGYLGATNDSGSQNGAAYVFVRSGSTWTHQAYLKAPNNSNYDRFGVSAAIDGDTIVIGACNEESTTTGIINGADLSATNDAGDTNGAVYVFARSGSTWTHQAYLKAPNNSGNDLFGASVAISGNTVVVGSYSEDSTTTGIIHGADLNATNNNGANNGAAYVFVRSGSTWTHQAYLKAPNGSEEDYFGFSVAVSGNTIVAGAYHEAGTTAAIINGSDLSATNDNGDTNGAAYVFIRQIKYKWQLIDL